MWDIRDAYDPDSAQSIHKKLEQFAELVERGDEVPVELMQFIAAGVRRFIGCGVPWPVKTGAKPVDDVLLMTILSIDEKFPGNRHQIAEYAGVSVRQVRNYIKDAKALLNSDPRIEDILRSCMAQDENRTLPELLKSLAYAKEFLSGKEMPPIDDWHPDD